MLSKCWFLPCNGRDHISAARSGFSAGGSISFGLNSGKASSSADNATSMDQTASVDTALSPLSRNPSNLYAHCAAASGRHSGLASGIVMTAGSADMRSMATATAAEETADSSTAAEQSGERANGSWGTSPRAGPVGSGAESSPGAMDATVHALELSRLHLTQRCSAGIGSRTGSPAVIVRGSGNGKTLDEQSRLKAGPAAIPAPPGSKLAVQEFTRAGLLAQVQPAPADAAMAAARSSGIELGAREAREPPSPLAQQQERRQQHLQGRRTSSVRSLSDPVGSSAYRREAVAAALASCGVSHAVPPAMPPQQRHSQVGSLQTSPQQQQPQQVLWSLHQPLHRQQPQPQTSTATDADVGVSLSRLLQLQVGRLPLPNPARRALDLAAVCRSLQGQPLMKHSGTVTGANLIFFF